MATKRIAALIVLLSTHSVAAKCRDGSNAADDLTTTYKDVVIVGGGASGVYSAVRLREDYGLSVVVVEKDIQLKNFVFNVTPDVWPSLSRLTNKGGHVNTWIDPATGRGFEAGVQSYIDLANATNFFKRFGVATGPNNRPAQQTPLYVDFSTGTKLSNYVAPAAADRNDALRRYLALAEKYLPQMEPGWWAFPAPEDIPADLLMPFRDAVEKYNLTAAVPQLFATTGFGMHDLMSSLTLWVLRSFSVDMCRTILGIKEGFVPTSGRNQDLYDNLLTFLGSDVLLSTTVVKADRSDKGVVLEVRNSVTCATTRIIAKRLLYTLAPTAENLAPFSLDETEHGVFGNFSYSTSFVGVVSHPSLPRNISITNTPAATQGENWAAAIPKFPYNTRFDNYANSSYYRVVAVGDPTLTEEKARAVVTTAFEKMVASGTIKQTEPPQPLKIEYFQGHGLVNAHATQEVLVSGFLQKLNGLQGRRSTWYTGAAWSVHITTSLWIFTDTVLPKLVDSLLTGSVS